MTEIHFPFSTLPNELKNSIIEFTNPCVAIHLVAVNHELRNMVFEKGPFPKNLKEIHLNFENSEIKNDWCAQVQCLIPHLAVKTFFDCPKCDESGSFSITENLITPEWFPSIYTLRAFLFSKHVRFCKTIRITLKKLPNWRKSIEVNEGFLKRLFEKNRIFPNLHYVSNLHVDLQGHHSLIEAFLENLCPKPLNICVLNVSALRKHMNERSVRECLEKFVHDHQIKNCKLFNSNCHLNFYFDLFNEERTFPELFTGRATNWNEYRDLSFKCWKDLIKINQKATVWLDLKLNGNFQDENWTEKFFEPFFVNDELNTEDEFNSENVDFEGFLKSFIKEIENIPDKKFLAELANFEEILDSNETKRIFKKEIFESKQSVILFSFVFTESRHRKFRCLMKTIDFE